ncbi:response regulator [Paenibacillaceae bacterium WGS1546]|uniref:response regulator transcription factor n=1 Tax=Cohnella sp. WGS1546 TaxID=3366810 RepID=UPI00372D3989
MQLLIVDDESHVVDRLATTIGWHGIGITQVYRAYSGQEALAVLQQFAIDIVITDIQMPGMSGLDLIARIRRDWSKTKCVLLSGYSDFHYAKEAIQNQVEDYLLKPVTEQELLDTVSKLMQKLCDEWKQILSVRNLTKTLNENMPLLKGKLLLELLQGPVWNEGTLKEKMAALALPDLHGQVCFLMLVRLEETFVDYDFRSQSLIEYAIGNMAEELFNGKFRLWHAKDAHDDLIFLAAAEERVEAGQETALFENTASQLQAAVKSFLKGSISIVVSEAGVFPREVSDLYDSCVSAARKRVGNEQGLFLRASGEAAGVEVESIRSLYEPPTLIHLLEAGRWDGMAEKLDRIFEELQNKISDLHSQEHLLEVYFAVSSAFSYISHKNGQPLSDLIGEDYDKLANGIPFRSVQHLREWSQRVLRRLMEDRDREMKDSRSELIRAIHKFIDENLAQDVTLQSIADHVHMHPVYISKIYKLETGGNISEYIQQLRMERAVYLLANSSEKTYEIAAKLGYQRPHSFNYAFKKHHGVTPQMYRDQQKKGAICP